MSTAAEFRDHLTAFSELYASLGESPLLLPQLTVCLQDRRIRKTCLRTES